MDNKKEALNEYLKLEQKLKDYRGQFMGKAWENDVFNEPKKVLTPDAIVEIKKIEKEVEESREKYLNS